MRNCDYPACTKEGSFELQLGDNKPLVPQERGWCMIYVCDDHNKLSDYTKVYDRIVNTGLLKERIVI